MKSDHGRFPVRVLACAAALLAPACTPSDGEVTPYLLVEPAERQPASPALGTIVVLQQKGGKFLRMKVEGGALTLPGAAPGAEAPAGACSPALPDGDLAFYGVVPVSGECVLSVELLGAGADCTGTVLATKILPVSTTRTAVDSTTGAGGAGGASATSSGTTGAGGAGGK